MKKAFLYVMMTVLFHSCKMDKADCKKYFAGKWKYEQYAPETAYVIRTLDKQIEYVENGKYHYDFDIKWLSDCSYQLIYIGTNSSTPAKAKIGETTVVEIVDIEAAEMKYHTKFRNLEEVGKMTKL